MEFENTIGLETHVQLKTNTKMFCGCLLKTGCEPNTNVCPVCLGYPGALPVMNKEAVRMTVMSGMMLGCEINRHATFDRKNYFYPDMAKDYQISENGNPLCIGGGVEITRADGTKKLIRINHIHLEEDAAKINHYAQSSGVDFNRGGTPLMEIVSEPDMESADDAILYLTALKEMLVYAGVSDCNLEEGNMRSDVNISIRPKDGKGLPTKADGKIDFSKLGTKVEIKNMNTFKGIHAALCYEARRQRECMAHSIPIVQETRRWDGEALETASMRSKENAHDYRYFPEPDLVPVELSQEQIDEWRKLLPEKPEARRARMIAEYGIAEYDAEVLSQHKDNADYFERAAKGLDKKAAKQLCNLYMSDVMALMNASGKAIGECAMKPEALAALVKLSAAGTINGPTLKELLPEIFEKGGDPEAIVKERGLGAVSDTSALEAFVDQAIAANPGPVADFKAGKKAAAGFFVGQVMKLSKGKADPKIVGGIVAKKLAALCGQTDILARTLLFAFCAFLSWHGASAVEAMEGIGGPGPLNPQFEEWLDLKRKGMNLSKFNGMVPSPTTAVGAAPQNVLRAVAASALPRRYDPRQNGGKLVPVRQQGSYGTCWAHAGMASMEITSLMEDGRLMDFSESHAANNHGYDYDGWSVGNSDMLEAYVLRWQGPVLEAHEKYPSRGVTTTVPPARHIQNICHVAPKSSALANDAIKRAIQKYGALTASYYHDDSYYSSANSSYCCPSAHATSHVIAIVGWDDDFPRTKFKTMPSGNGAYIVRNSWGANWGESGYFYVSYYDAVLAKYQMYAFVADEYPDNYGSVYQHDTYGYCTTWGWGNATGCGANIFTAAKAETIAAVGFYALSPNTTYTVSVYAGCTSGKPTSGTRKISQSGTFDEAGYHTVKLNTGVSVNKGARFSVVVSVTSPGVSHPLALEWRYDDYTSRVTANVGESFVSSSGQTWYDCVADNGTIANFCAKAYTKATSKPTTSAATGSVPHAWLDDYPEVLKKYNGNYEAAALHQMANGVPLYKSYVAMLDPNDRYSTFTMSIAMENGEPHLTFSPYRPDKRTYRVLGTSTLGTGAQWTAADEKVHHFFRATVAVP